MLRVDEVLGAAVHFKRLSSGAASVARAADGTHVEKALLDLMVVLVAAKVTGSPQSWPEGTSATHLRAAPLNFPVAYRTRAQEGGPVYVCPERESGAL